jgi:hypothetical protein
MTPETKYTISEEQLSELIGVQLFANPALAREIRSSLLSIKLKGEYERGYNDGSSAVVVDPYVLEYKAAKKVRELILPTDLELRAIKHAVCFAIQEKIEGYEVADSYYHKLKALCGRL